MAGLDRKICYIYHSESGNTRKVAERCAGAAGGAAIEIHDLQHYNRISKYLVGGRRATKGLMDPIEPSIIDVSGYDLIVIGSPVWGGRPTPAINTALNVMKGCEGKKGIVYVTCGAMPGDSINLIKKALEQKKMLVVGSMAFARKDLRDEGKLNSLIDLIKAAGVS